MPGGDGSGPTGMGPMTGRAAGYCAGYGSPGYVNPIPGRGGFGFGRGRGFGLGRGFRGGRGWGVAPNPLPEPQALREQADNLQQSLEDIRQRLADLEARQE